MRLTPIEALKVLDFTDLDMEDKIILSASCKVFKEEYKRRVVPLPVWFNRRLKELREEIKKCRVKDLRSQIKEVEAPKAG